MNTALQDCEFLWAKRPSSEPEGRERPTNEWQDFREWEFLKGPPVLHRCHCITVPGEVSSLSDIQFKVYFPCFPLFLFRFCDSLCIFYLAIPFILNLRSFLDTTDILSLSSHRIQYVSLCPPHPPPRKKSNSSCILEMALSPLVFLRCLRHSTRL